jgi:hypothetical protein
VSQASARNLAIEKAKAKSGAAGAAAEAARQEKLNVAERGVALSGQAQAGATNQLLGVQAGQQAGLATPQVGGVTPTEGLGAAQIQAKTETELGTQEFGTRTRADDVTHTQKGIEQPVMSSGASGAAPTGAATVGNAPHHSPGEPALAEDGALITAGSAGAALSNTRPIGSGLMGSLRTALNGVGVNPR